MAETIIGATYLAGTIGIFAMLGDESNLLNLGGAMIGWSGVFILALWPMSRRWI